MIFHSQKSLKLWVIFLPLLVIANAVYKLDNILAWLLTLGFFLFVPGYLLLRKLGQTKHFSWATYSLSVGLSLSILTIVGLALNSASFFGLERPLQTLYIFVALDIASLVLIALNFTDKLIINVPKVSLNREGFIFSILFGLLPLLAIGGAFRLNNGASNILTMIMMGLIGAVFIIMMFRPGLQKIYPFALFMTALSLLFCISLRGWSITGHDIHHEFSVFNSVMVNDYWQYRTTHGDPYNACLSITILPAILAKITTIVPIYIYKVVFQVIFASMIPALYAFARKFASQKKALLGIFAFMTFPTFTNDLPFLNRQEIAFAYFILILYVNFTTMANRAKTILTTLLLVSIILSHYSTSYATISLLLVALGVYKILSKILHNSEQFRIPLLRTPIMLMAFLATFVWNAQITSSSSNLSNTLTKTISGIFGQNSEASNFGHYNLLSTSASRSPFQQFANFAHANNSSAQYIAPTTLPVTPLGKTVSKLVDVKKLNTATHTIIAKILQLLVLIGTGLMLLKFLRRKENLTARNIYHLSFSISCLIALVVFTLLPQLSIGYDVTRLFQQSMMVLWLPVVVASSFVFSWLGRFKLAASAGLLVFLYFNLGGFMPQLTGGFLPQISLNNSGLYYDYFYTHRSDVVASNWLADNRVTYLNVFMDTNSAAPPLRYSVAVGLISGYTLGYYYQDYTNNTRGIYRTFFSSGFVEYTNPTITNNKNLMYSNGTSTIYYGGKPL